MHQRELSSGDRLRLRTDLLADNAARHKRDGDPGVLASVEQEILRRERQGLDRDSAANSVGRIEVRTDSGAYRGLIVGETQRHIVQSLAGRRLVAHNKANLARPLKAGENVEVRYSNGHATVRNTPPRVRARGQGR